MMIGLRHFAQQIANKTTFGFVGSLLSFRRRSFFVDQIQLSEDPRRINKMATVAELKVFLGLLDPTASQSGTKTALEGRLNGILADKLASVNLDALSAAQVKSLADAIGAGKHGTKAAAKAAIAAKVGAPAPTAAQIAAVGLNDGQVKKVVDVFAPATPAPVTPVPTPTPTPTPVRRRSNTLWWILGAALGLVMICGVLAFAAVLAPRAVAALATEAADTGPFGLDPNPPQASIVIGESPIESLPEEEQEPASAPVSINPEDFAPQGYEPQYVDRSKRVWHSYRLEVNDNGEPDQAALIVTENLDYLLLSRVVPDDHLTQAWCQAPNSDQKIDILTDLGMVNVGKGGTGDAALDAWLAANEVNVTEGELLAQNSQVISFTSVPAGFSCYFHVADDAELGVNVGLDILTGGQMPTDRVKVIDLK